MTIALLVIASLVLVATMLVLTVGVNELEKKTAELGELVRKRYTLRAPEKKKNNAATPGKAGPGPAAGRGA